MCKVKKNYLCKAMALKIYIETYGCQMNINDSQIASAILCKAGHTIVQEAEDADVILINTCSVRDNAEQRVLGRLDFFAIEKKKRKNLKVGVMGCMAQRLKDELLKNKTVDFTIGPDSLRNLPSVIDQVKNSGVKLSSTVLSLEETYSDIEPVRCDSNGVSAFISITRGCNNMCSYCIVPFTRGRERSRNPKSIIKEAEDLFAKGYKEVTLLGQNVDSYLWVNPENPTESVNFYQLLESVAAVSPQLRVRFQTSHPKDIRKGVLYTMAMYPNICKHIHLPVQSGSNEQLKKMNRKYTREEYLSKIADIREIIPECAITTDVITGFSDESPEDFEQTLSLMEEVGFDSAFMFKYSERPNTLASRKYLDNIPEDVKIERLNRMIELQNKRSLQSNRKDIGKTFEVLVEGTSKRSESQLFGRNTHNKVCVFDADKNVRIGDYVYVKITDCTSATLLGQIEKRPKKTKLIKGLEETLKEEFEVMKAKRDEWRKRNRNLKEKIIRK